MSSTWLTFENFLAAGTVISGVIACIAAHKSASHAKAIHDANHESEKRTQLNQITFSAQQAHLTIERTEWLLRGLLIEYQTLAGWTNNFGNSRLEIYKTEIINKQERLGRLKETVTPFVQYNSALINGPIEEINQRQVILSQALLESTHIKGMVEDEITAIRGQNQQFRDASIKRINS